MVAHQLRGRGITDRSVLEAFSGIPREKFVLPQDQSRAYDDCPLPIGWGQTISQPYIVALMLEVLEIKPGDKVLEVGAGSGYQTALLAFMQASLFSVELVSGLVSRAREVLDELRLKASLIQGDGSQGWEEKAPFDKIIVSAAAPEVPAPLKKQLGCPGRMIIPIGDRVEQQLICLDRITADEYTQSSLGWCVFVPLLGKYGFET